MRQRISQINDGKCHNQEQGSFGPGQQPKKKSDAKAAEIENLESLSIEFCVNKLIFLAFKYFYFVLQI